MFKRRVVWSAIAMAALIVALSPGTSEARTPRYKTAQEDISSFQKSKVVDDPETAYAYYADLAPGKMDIYTVYAQPGQPGSVRLLVPKVDHLKDFAPTVALVGPGIPANVPTDTLPFKLSDSLSASLPYETGAMLLEYAGHPQSRPTEVDASLQTTYWKGPEHTFEFTQAAPYHIVVWDKSGREGKYVLVVGTQDKFGLFDLIKFPYTWLKIHAWLGDWLILGIAGIALLLIIIGIARFLRRRRRVVVTSPPAEAAPST